MKMTPIWRLRRFAAPLLVLAACCCAGLTTARAQSADDVTVGFLYNFARFVQWPPTAFGDASTPFTIGFVGRSALADAFAKNVVGRNVNGREFSVKKLEGASGAEACQIVFVGDPGQASNLVGALKGKPVLVVGEGDAFLSAGGMIAFKKEGARLVFDVNLEAIKASQLTTDPKVEKAAHAIKSS